MPPPNLDDVKQILAYTLNRPVESLSIDEIRTEHEHWRALLKEHCWTEFRRQVKAKSSPGTKSKILRWGGVILALAGIPACFAALPVGLTVAIAGAGLTSYDVMSHVRESSRRRKIEEAVLFANERWDILDNELSDRFNS